MDNVVRLKKNTSENSWPKVILNIVIALVWVFSVVIVSQLIVGFLMIWILGESKFEHPVWVAVYSALSYVIALILIIFPPIFIQKKKLKDFRLRSLLGLNGMPTWIDIGILLAGFLIYLVIALGLTKFFELFPWFDAEQAQDTGFSLYISGFDRIIAFITLVVIAPIAEEIIFRGWLYAKLRTRLNKVASKQASIAISILLVSLLFGIVHMQWNVGVNVFAMSVVLCGLREITGTIYSGILLHMVKNGLAFYLLYVLGV